MNEEYEDGGVFYIRPRRRNMKGDDPLPQMEDGEDLVWGSTLNDVHRKNTTRIGFPHLETGDVFLHNFTVFHGVAPISSGTRYTLVFFYDMNHPAVDRYRDKNVFVRLINNYDEPVDLVQYNPEDDSREVEDEDLDDETVFDAVSDDQYEIVSRITGDVLDTFEIDGALEDNQTIVITVGDDDDEDEDDEDEDEDDELPEGRIEVNIINHHDDVDLFYIDEAGERSLIQEDVPDEIELQTELGEEFELVSRNTQEILEFFRIDEGDKEEAIVLGEGEDDDDDDDDDDDEDDVGDEDQVQDEIDEAVYDEPSESEVDHEEPSVDEGESEVSENEEQEL